MNRRSLSRTQTGITVVTAAIATAILGASVWRQQINSEAAVTAVVAAANTALGPFRLGEAVRNRVHLKLRLELGGRGRPQALDVAGNWTATPTDIHDGIVEMQCVLANIEAKVDANADANMGGTVSPAPNEEQERVGRELATALAAPFFISYRADGTIASLWFSRGVNPAIVNLQMTLAGVQQLVRGRPGEPAWVVQERDVNGQYTAAYRESEPGRFEKRKGRYLTASSLTNAVVAGPLTGAGSQRLSPSIRIERSDFELRTDRQGRLLEARGEEKLVFELGSPGLAMKTVVEVELEDGRTAQAPGAIGAFARARAGLESRPLEQMGGDAEAEIARRDRAVLGGASFDDLRAALRRLPKDMAPDAAEVGPLRRRFEALFRLDGAAVSRGPGLAREEPPARSKIVVDALSLARTVAGQSALAAIASDTSAPKRARGDAIQYLAHQDAPSTEVVSALVALLDDVDPDLRKMARLTYGAFARSLHSTAPEPSRRITRDLLARLEHATAAAERAELVVAIGNSGSTEALPALRRLVESGAMRERAQAIDALRFVEDPSVDSLLTEILSVSPDESVRLAVISAVRFRDVGPYASVLAGVARKDPSATVRNAALSLLGDRLSTLPTLRPVLEEIQNSDGATRNRELAARYLGSGGG